jgi:hypothetical protein
VDGDHVQHDTVIPGDIERLAVVVRSLVFVVCPFENTGYRWEYAEGFQLGKIRGIFLDADGSLTIKVIRRLIFG